MVVRSPRQSQGNHEALDGLVLIDILGKFLASDERVARARRVTLEISLCVD